VPKKKDYVIPLIRKVVWRGVEEGEGGNTEGVVSGGNEKLTLDKEAAEAILSDLKKAKSEEGEEEGGGQMIPLLLQNKPPVREESETGELADLSMRPEPVR
jgi:hypothetical protein